MTLVALLYISQIFELIDLIKLTVISKHLKALTVSSCDPSNEKMIIFTSIEYKNFSYFSLYTLGCQLLQYLSI